METKLSRKELLKIWIIKNSGKLARALLDKRFVVFTEYQKEIEDDIVQYIFEQDDVAAVEKTGVGICVYPLRI